MEHPHDSFSTGCEDGRHSVAAPMQNDFTLGRALRQALVEDTMSHKAEHALMHTGKLRMGLEQEPVPSDVQLAVATSSMNPDLRPLLLHELNHGVDLEKNLAAASGTTSRSSNTPSSVRSPAHRLGQPTEQGEETRKSTSALSNGSDNNMPVKKVLTMRRTNVPQRPSLSSVMSSESSSAVSKAPFGPSVSRVVKTAQDSAPIEVGIKIGKQAVDKQVNSSTPASIAGVLRNASSSPRSSKRKRDESFGIDSPHTNQAPSIRTNNTSSATSSSAASPGIVSSAFELFKRFTPDGASVISTSKPQEPSKRGPHQIRTTQTSQIKPTGLEVDMDTTLESQRRQQSFKKSFNGDVPISNEEVIQNTEVEISSSEDDVVKPDEQDLQEEDYIMGDVDEESNTSDISGNEIETDTTDLSSTATMNSALMADEGRPYNVWRADGQEKLTHGALLPTGYWPQLENERPWICPVRSCRLIFAKLESLGGHFNRKHRAAKLNDNGDGTLSVTGYRVGVGKLPAIVVSKKPLNPEEPPMQAPGLPGNVKDSDIELAALSKTSSKPKETLTKHASVHKTEGNTASVELGDAAIWTWEHIIHPYLDDTPIAPIPAKGYVQDLLPLPRARNIEPNPLAPKYFESRAQDISAIIIQITGQKAPRPCQRCQEGKGPFRGCIVISPKAPLHVRRSVTSCANCFYKGNQKNCGDLSKWHQKTYPELRDSASASHKVPLQVVDSSGPVEQAQSPGRRSTRFKQTTGASPTTQLIAAEAQTTGLEFDEPLVRPSRQKRSVLQTKSGSKDNHASLDTRFSIGSNDDALGLAMEDWEIAPGRVRNESDDGIENIAFSAAYLAHGEEVSVGPAVGFHVLVIKPGTIHRFQPATKRMRICSIATGKVHIRILNQEFDLGPNGMFHIMPDRNCIVENRIYGDATLHVTVMPEEFSS